MRTRACAPLRSISSHATGIGPGAVTTGDVAGGGAPARPPAARHPTAAETLARLGWRGAKSAGTIALAGGMVIVGAAALAAEAVIAIDPCLLGMISADGRTGTWLLLDRWYHTT